MLALAAAGASSCCARSPRVLAILALAFGPYAVFHLLFQETHDHPLRAAARSAHRLSRRRRADRSRRRACRGIVAVALAGAGLAVVVPAAAAFGRTPSPIFALLSEMRMLQERGAQPVVGMHRRVFTESRRARLYAGDVPGTLLPTPRDYEWLELTRAWREGHDGETWFVADPRRTDLALIDRRTRAHAPVSLAVQRRRLRRRRQARRDRLAHARASRGGFSSRAGR